MARCDEHVARYADHCASYRSTMMIDFFYLVCVAESVCFIFRMQKYSEHKGRQQRSNSSYLAERDRESLSIRTAAQSNRVCDRPTLNKVNHSHTFATFYSNSILLRNGIYGSWIRPKDYMLYACQLQHLHKSFRFSLSLSQWVFLIRLRTNLPVTNDAIIMLESSPPLMIKLLLKEDITQPTAAVCSLRVRVCENGN